MRWLAILALAACAQKKPPQQPSQQQGSAAPTVTDPQVDQRGADDGRASPDPSPTPLPASQPGN